MEAARVLVLSVPPTRTRRNTHAHTRGRREHWLVSVVGLPSGCTVTRICLCLMLSGKWVGQDAARSTYGGLCRKLVEGSIEPPDHPPAPLHSFPCFMLISKKKKKSKQSKGEQGCWSPPEAACPGDRCRALAGVRTASCPPGWCLVHVRSSQTLPPWTASGFKGQEGRKCLPRTCRIPGEPWHWWGSESLKRRFPEGRH